MESTEISHRCPTPTHHSSPFSRHHPSANWCIFNIDGPSLTDQLLKSTVHTGIRYWHYIFYYGFGQIYKDMCSPLSVLQTFSLP